jgi:hypothetical protein
MKKQDTPPIALQQLALAIINERYLPEEYLRIYTDGSLSKTDGKATPNYSPTTSQLEAIELVLMGK